MDKEIGSISNGVLGRIVALHAGEVTPLGPDGQLSGIIKQPVTGTVEVGTNGLTGDVQVDRRAHGGPEKAVHLYGIANYPVLAQHFAAPKIPFVPGSFGENLSCEGIADDTVRLGDVFRIGSVTLEVSQPRTPCWKLDAKFELDGLAAYVLAHRRVGWYCRVLEPGSVSTGDEIHLFERDQHKPTIREFWDIVKAEKPDIDLIAELADLPSLTLEWRMRLAQRRDWLKRDLNADVVSPTSD